LTQNQISQTHPNLSMVYSDKKAKNCLKYGTIIMLLQYATPDMAISVELNSVHHEILSSVIIVFYDKVRGRNKVQR